MGAYFKRKYATTKLSFVEYDFMKKIPYSNVTGSLIYAMTNTRLDIACAISLMSRFMSKSYKE